MNSQVIVGRISDSPGVQLSSPFLVMVYEILWMIHSTDPSWTSLDLPSWSVLMNLFLIFVIWHEFILVWCLEFARTDNE